MSSAGVPGLVGPSSKQDTPRQTASMFGDLDEEELLAMELAEEDLALDEDEEEEWRRYDEEVESFRELMAAEQGADIDGTLAVSAAASAADLLRASLPKGTVPDAAAVRNGVSGGQAKRQVNELDQLDAALSELDLAEEELLALLGDTNGVSKSSNGANRAGAQAQSSVLTGNSAEALALREALWKSLNRQRDSNGVESGSATPASPWAPGLPSSVPGQPAVHLSEEYKSRLAEGEGGVVVSNCLGPQTVVLLNGVADGPELLPLVSETFRVQRVRILRGWLETNDGLALNVFEVCDSKTKESLTDEGVDELETALVQALRAPAAREILLEIDEQVPRMSAFYGLPASGSRPPSVPAVRGALLDSAFNVKEARDLGRALILRGDVAAGASPSEALDESRVKIANICKKEEGEWECLMAKGKQGLLLVVVPAEDVEEIMQPLYDDRIVCFLCIGLAAVYAQGAAPASPGVFPTVGTFLLTIMATAEIVRWEVARRYGVRLGLPLLLPSPAVGTFGAITCTKSLVPSATASFDIAAAALNAAFLASFSLIGFGLLTTPDSHSCSWVNANVFPAGLKRLVLSEAEPWWNACMEAAPGIGYTPAPAALIAGCFGAVGTALNALPLTRLDGLATVEAAPLEVARGTLLPWAAFLLLASTSLETGSDNLFGVVLGFAVYTFFVRPQFERPVVLRDNATQPRDIARRTSSLVLLLVAFILLMPSALVDNITVVYHWFFQ